MKLSLPNSRSLASAIFRIVCAVLLAIGPGTVHQAFGEAEPLRDSYAAEQVSEHVYVIHGPNGLPSAENQGFMNNPGFILSSEGVVVVDPGSSLQVGRMVLDQVALVTAMPVIATIASHIHGDHWLGNQAVLERFPTARLYAHPDLIELAASGEAENWIDLMSQLTAGATDGTVAAIPDLQVKDGDALRFGDIEVFIHHKGIAHTTNDIALLVQPDNTLFTGDLVFNHRVGRMDDGNFSGLLASLDHLIGLAPAVVVPGHGRTGDVSLMKDMHRLTQLIYQTVEEKFAEGLTDYEIKPFVLEQLEGFADWGGFEDSIGRLVSLSYLEVEENNF